MIALFALLGLCCVLDLHDRGVCAIVIRVMVVEGFRRDLRQTLQLCHLLARRPCVHVTADRLAGNTLELRGEHAVVESRAVTSRVDD